MVYLIVVPRGNGMDSIDVHGKHGTHADVTGIGHSRFEMLYEKASD